MLINFSKLWFKRLIVLLMLVVLHELGHYIASLFIDCLRLSGYKIHFPDSILNFDLNNLFSSVIFTWTIKYYSHDVSIFQWFMFLLIVPLILEYSYLYVTKQNKWWYVIAIVIHRGDIFALLRLLGVF